MERKIIKDFYKYLVELNKEKQRKLKIVCDWDEVIQPHEPYSL